MRENLLILIQRAVLEHPIFSIPSPSEVRSRDSGLPRDTRKYCGYFGKRSGKAYLLERDHPHLSSKIQRIWHHLLEEEEHERRRVWQYPLHVLIRALHPLNPYCHTGVTYSLNGMMDYWRFQISEMSLGKFPGSMEFQEAGKSSSRLKCVQNQQTLNSQCTGSKKLR